MGFRLLDEHSSTNNFDTNVGKMVQKRISLLLADKNHEPVGMIVETHNEIANEKN